MRDWGGMRTKAILESDVESILMHSTPKLAPLGLAIDVGGEGVVLFLLLLPTCSNGVQQAGLVHVLDQAPDGITMGRAQIISIAHALERCIPLGVHFLAC